jgi:hypothetical protein
MEHQEPMDQVVLQVQTEHPAQTDLLVLLEKLEQQVYLSSGLVYGQNSEE